MDSTKDEFVGFRWLSFQIGKYQLFNQVTDCLVFGGCHFK